MIYQCNPIIFVMTPLGPGMTLFLIDYGININSCWVVALRDTNYIKHFDSNDIRIIENLTYGFKKPAMPIAGEKGY